MSKNSIALCATLLLVTLMAAGCGNEAVSKGPDGRASLKCLAFLYGQYVREHSRAPQNEKDFRDYLNAIPPEDRKHIGFDDVDGLFVSPRDGEAFVVQYGATPDVVAYEKTGHDGRRLVAELYGSVVELDEAAFQELNIPKVN